MTLFIVCKGSTMQKGTHIKLIIIWRFTYRFAKSAVWPINWKLIHQDLLQTQWKQSTRSTLSHRQPAPCTPTVFPWELKEPVTRRKYYRRQQSRKRQVYWNDEFRWSLLRPNRLACWRKLPGLGFQLSAKQSPHVCQFQSMQSNWHVSKQANNICDVVVWNCKWTS